jgi:hypothetical protein
LILKFETPEKVSGVSKTEKDTYSQGNINYK